MAIKIKFFTLLCGLLVGNVSMQAWQGRVIPVAYNATNNEWSLLLGRDTSTNTWSDFKQNAQRGQKGNVVAQKALNTQTNGVYNLPMNGATWIKLPRNDVMHFLQVPFIRGTELYKSARNIFKDDFVWIPISELLGKKSVTKKHDKRDVDVDPYILSTINKYWQTDVATKLASSRPQPGIPTTPTQGQPCYSHETWFSLPGAIYFYDSGKPYYEFTNFKEEYPITITNKKWPTTEHYYQAQKFVDPAMQEAIRTFKTAREAFDYTKTHQGISIRPDWKMINLEVMLTAVRAKFTQHAQLTTMLKNTGDAILVEDARGKDSFFGDGADGHGCNHLGQILMRVRDELNGKIQPTDPYTANPPSFYTQPKQQPMPVNPFINTTTIYNALQDLQRTLNELVSALHNNVSYAILFST